MNFQSKQQGAISQALLIAMVMAVTIIAVTALVLLDQTLHKDKQQEHGEATAQQADEQHDEHEEEAIALTQKQMLAYGLKLASVEMGEVQSSQSLPSKLSSNLDQKAHVTSMFAGRVEAVYVNLNQKVKKGQALAQIISPDLVAQQSDLRLAKTNLQLKQQEYEQEKHLSAEGATAKRDFQRAEHAYQQAQIAVKESQSRLAALGAELNSNGRYTLTAPMSGVISSKDILVGEYIEISKQLLVIDEPYQLWLELILPPKSQVAVNQELEFISLQSQQRFKARIQHINAQADNQTGRLQVRATVLSKAEELRPNLMVNVLLASGTTRQAVRIEKQAIQQLEGKDTVFIAKQHGDKVEFYPQRVDLGDISGEWVEVRHGLEKGQTYLSQGSFLLKSESEKGEAAHGH